MNIIKKLNIFILIIVLLSFNVVAFGIVTSWWPGNPLVLEPGETRDVHFTLQNGAGATEDVIAIVDFINGKEIAEIIDNSNSYLVPAGGEAKVNIRIKIPENAKINDQYIVGITVTSTPGKQRGPVLFGSGAEATFPVLIQYHEPIKEEPTPTGEVVKGLTGQYNLSSIIGMLLVIAIVIFIFYKLHYKKSGTDTKKRGKKRS